MNGPSAATRVVNTVRSADGTTIGYRCLGRGDPVIVLGGSMRAAVDYLPFAEVLAQRFRVHLVDRRGRGLSGPLGEGYAIERECDDLLAVHAATGARMLFGHSYGGLVALETAARPDASDAFDRIAVYEPGVSVNGSIPTGWLPRYRRFLDRGETRRAFAYFVQQSGHAPGPVASLPLWYLRAVLRLVVRNAQWERFEPLLGANLVEHEQVAACDSTYPKYAAIKADLLLLRGSKSPSFTPLDLLQQTVRQATVEVLDGLDHNAPDEKAPAAVASRVLRFFAAR